MTIRLRDTSPNAPTVYATEAFGRATGAHEGGEWKYLSDEQGMFGIPLIIRSIPNSRLYDAVTPYGYGGIHLDDSLTDEDALGFWSECLEVLRGAKVVSMFLRFPPFCPRQAERAASLPNLEVERVSSTVLVETRSGDDPLSSFSSSCRKQVRRGLRDGLTAQVIDVNESAIRRFTDLYTTSMVRLGARESYYFGDSYFDSLKRLGTERAKILEVRDANGRLAASTFALVDEDVVHQHLSGSDLSVRGGNNVRVWALIDWAKSRGITKVHLGGGTKENDSLFRFKESFGGTAVDFHVGRMVVDRAAYEQLSRGRETTGAQSNYFPLYRTPVNA